MPKHGSPTANVISLDAYRSRRAADDAEIHEVAYLLHTVLGDSVDNFDFAYLVDIAAGIAR